MIEVVIRHKESGVELGRIDIENVADDDNAEFGDYSVQFGVEKIGGVGIHQRGLMRFPRKKYNVLALLLQALNTLREEELELDGDFGDRVYEHTDRVRLGLAKGNFFRR